MRPYSVLVLSFCILSALALDNQEATGVRDILKIYNDCWKSDGLAPCLKIKALTLLNRVGRMEKLTLFDGVVLKGKEENTTKQSESMEEVEKTLPRSADAKSKALSQMIIDRVARMIGSKTIEISLPTLINEARKKGGGDDKFGDIGELFEGGGEGGGHGGGGGKRKKEKGGKHEKGMKDFLMDVMAHKIALIPLFIGGLFILAVKALTDAKIALLIAGIIFVKKLLASKNQGGGSQVQHVSAGWSGSSGGGGYGGGYGGGGSIGGGGGHGGGGGGWSSGGGWDKRSIDVAQNLAFKGQKQA